jgi:signal peptidase I
MFKRLGAFFLDVSEIIVFAIGIFFFVYLLIMRPHKIDGESMMPNYLNAEYLLTEKVTYYLNKPQRGDVVVLRPPEGISGGSEFIKRIIGLPGENIKVSEGHVYINDKLLNEPYLTNDVLTSSGTFLPEDTDYKVPSGQYFLMGDNREHSSDSRYWGPVPLNLSPNSEKIGINGRAWLIYWSSDLKRLGFTKSPVYSYGN